MTDMIPSGNQRTEPLGWSAVVPAIAAYVPPDDQVAAVLAYLRDIRDAADLLPRLDPTADPLGGCFDPSWPSGDA